MYQVHYTLNNLTTSYNKARETLPKDIKLIEHYNLVNGIKHYELLTSSNHKYIPVLSDIGLDTIRIKVETTTKPQDWVYIEKHYKLNEIPDLPTSQYVMFTEVINPIKHKYVLTIRDSTMLGIETIEATIKMNPIKTTTEYCIIDTNEKIDYIHFSV